MKLSTILREQIAALVEKRDGLLAVENSAEFTTERSAEVKGMNEQLKTLRAELADAETAEAAETEQRKAAPVEVVRESNPVYRKNGSESYFRDLFTASTSGDTAARDRLVQSQERALSTGASAGGTFAPPAWLVEDFIALARSARVTADLVNHNVLPEGVSSINLPSVATGTTVAAVQNQNTAVSNTDLTTSSVSSNITTISGQQVASLQLLKQSAIPLDRVILGDLALAYASQIDVQVLSGSGSNGQLKGLIAGGTAVTFTSASPAVVSTTAANSFYNKVIAAQAAVANTRFLPANAIVMSPTRWGWILQALDGQQRPLVTPNGPTFNGLAVTGDVVAQGLAGTIAGLPVYVDPNIPANLGAGTNQDAVYVLRTDDHWLYETAVEQASFEATYANQNSVLFRVLGFSAFLTRYAGSAQVIQGTGLVVPTL